MSDPKFVELTANIVSAYVGNHSVPVGEIPALISQVHAALARVSSGADLAAEPLKPAIPVKKSITPEYLVCLEDGKKLTMMRRYLMTNFGMTPDEYRAKWNLPKDYPMVAPNYAEKRRELAKQIGLGTKGRGGGRKPAARGRAKAK